MLKKKAQLASLGEWTHINGLERSAHGQVKDEILGHMLHKFESAEEENMSLDVKPSKSRLENLLDISNVSSTAEPEAQEHGLSVHDVPGGTISFIFERFSDSTDAVDDD
jgi:DNA repair and recombination protein RAD54B